MILDVGCGDKPHGDVNCDRFFKYGSRVISFNPKEIKNFVFCDSFSLPFREDCFEVVLAIHILEHLDNPIKAIQEMKRVSAKRVVIKVPNASYFKWKNSCEAHIFSWNQYTLRNLLERYFGKVTINSTQRDFSKSRLRKAVSIILTLLHGHTELTAICFK